MPRDRPHSPHRRGPAGRQPPAPFEPRPRQWWRPRPPTARREAEELEPLPPATISADRAREIVQELLRARGEGLFAHPALPGVFRRRQVWLVPVGRLGQPDVVGDVVVDAATGAVSEARLP